MTDTEKKIAKIREALEKATPGPWVYDDIYDDIYADKTDVIVCYTVGPEDGRLIANAPEWLGILLDELEQTRKESNMLREELHKFQELAIKAANHHKAERDKLIEVLRWYADKTNYVQEVHHLRHGTLIGPAEAIYYDEGHRAREILKEIGGDGGVSWINVKERLPRSGDTVLVYYRRGDYRGADITRYIGRWLTVDPLVEVTHWMPLPEPPKGGENG